MPGSYLRRSWEVSSAPDGRMSGRAEKGNHNAAIDADEKSDTPIVSKKPLNKDRPAEEVEKRGVAKGKRSWIFPPTGHSAGHGCR